MSLVVDVNVDVAVFVVVVAVAVVVVVVAACGVLLRSCRNISKSLNSSLNRGTC